MALHRVSPVITLIRCRLRRHSRHPLHRSERPIYSFSRGSTQLQIISTVKKTEKTSRGGKARALFARCCEHRVMPLQKHNYETRKFLPPAGEVAQMQLYFYTRCESGRCFLFYFILFHPARRRGQKKLISVRSRCFKRRMILLCGRCSFSFFFFSSSHTTWTTIAAEKSCGRGGALENGHGAHQ